MGYVDTHIIIQNELVFQAHPKVAESHGQKIIREFLQQLREKQATWQKHASSLFAGKFIQRWGKVQKSGGKGHF